MIICTLQYIHCLTFDQSHPIARYHGWPQNHLIPLSHNDLKFLVRIERWENNTSVFNCTGVLISKKHVLTAYSCMGRSSQRFPAAKVEVRLLVHYRRSISKQYVYYPYEAYIMNSPLEHDLAILSLTKEIIYSFRYPVFGCCEELKRDAAIAVLGFDFNDDNKTLDPSHVSRIIPKIQNQTYCNSVLNAFGRYNRKTMVCVFTRNEKGEYIAFIGEGDAGAPLIYMKGNDVCIYGIASGYHIFRSDSPYGGNRIDLSVPSVFTKTLPYCKWICEKIGYVPLNICGKDTCNSLKSVYTVPDATWK